MNLTEKLNAAIKYSQNYPFDLDTTAIVNKWEKIKAALKKILGGTRVRSSEPIELELDEKERRKLFEDFKNKLLAKDFFFEDCQDFMDFLDNNYKTFFENRVSYPLVHSEMKRDSKLIKSFKYFIKDDPVLLRFAQDLASEYIQRQKITGYLYLSIDLLDFLSLSENTYNWRSCHALDGDYRVGNLSYALDNKTIIAYIADEKETKLPCFPSSVTCHSKKWRMLFHLHPEEYFVYYGRQYPFFSYDLLEKTYIFFKSYLNKHFKNEGLVCNELLAPAHRSFNSIDFNTTSNYLLTSNYVAYYGQLHDLAYFCANAPGAMNYNDIAFSTVYSPWISFSNWGSISKMTIGESVPCACCGELNISSPDIFICEDCKDNWNASEDFIIHCGCCGERVYQEDVHEDTNEFGRKLILCKKCYKELNGGN